MLRTMSQLLRHHRSMEEEQASYHNLLADSYPEHGEFFSRLGKDNLRHMEMAQRAYREGVTDAFEVGFLDEPADPEDYILTEPKGGLRESIRVMITNEEQIINYCVDVASNSSTLLPDVPETFMRLVKRKKRNIKKMTDSA